MEIPIFRTFSGDLSFGFPRVGGDSSPSGDRLCGLLQSYVGFHVRLFAMMCRLCDLNPSDF